MGPQDWPVVTVEGLLEELESSEDEELESSEEELVESSEEELAGSSEDEPVESSDDVVGSPDDVVGFSDEPVGSSDDEVVDPDEAAAVVCVPLEAEDCAPIEPSHAIAPNARAKVASDAAITRWRIRAIRAARARSLAWASCFGVRAGGVSEGAGRDAGGSGREGSREVGSGMVANLGTGSEMSLGGPWALAESRSALGQGPARTQAPPRHAADHLDVAGAACRLVPTQKESRMRTAMQKARPTGTPGSGTATDLTATLAKELGLSPAKVRAAMQALALAGRANGTPPQGAPPSGSAPSQGTSTTSGSAA
jgi:hypothetical protein